MSEQEILKWLNTEFKNWKPQEYKMFVSGTLWEEFEKIFIEEIKRLQNETKVQKL